MPAWRRLGVATLIFLLAFPVLAQEAALGEEALVDALRISATELRGADDLELLMERIGDARYVLLGEASHGTSEYYTWRARLSRRLIEEKGFSFVAVEGDWPDLYRVNRYLRGAQDAGESAYEVLHAFERWPTWMWANWEVVAFAEWLKGYNDGYDGYKGAGLSSSPEQKVGLYGLDVYSLWTSLDAVLAYAERQDPALFEPAERVRACFEPYVGDELAYARATLSGASCEAEAAELLEALRPNPQEAEDAEARFDAEQNALVIVNAARYYQAMAAGGPASWNIRDHHMADTLDRLMTHHGPDAKGVVWEHNTHIGDARATTMAEGGMINLGQLVRERHGEEEVVLVGFGSYRGSVIAARAWGAAMERMRMPEARAGSWEAIFHQAGARDSLLVLEDLETVEAALTPRGHRAIGVVYNPELEGFNYVPTVLPRRYDAFIYLDETEALHPLHLGPPKDPPQLYPWGF